MTGTGEQYIDIHLQKDDLAAALLERRAVFRLQNAAAARGDDAVVLPRNAVYDLRFDLSEAFLAVELEDSRNFAVFLGDEVVRIVPAHTREVGELDAYRRFARSHHSAEDNIHNRKLSAAKI